MEMFSGDGDRSFHEFFLPYVPGNWEGADNKARSISVELPEGLVCVGSGTTCVNTKLCKILDNL